MIYIWRFLVVTVIAEIILLLVNAVKSEIKNAKDFKEIDNSIKTTSEQVLSEIRSASQKRCEESKAKIKRLGLYKSCTDQHKLNE